MTKKNQDNVAATQTPSQEDLMAQIAALMAENAKLKAQPKGAPGITAKVSEKGAVSVYGLGRFPVTLYASQLIRFGDAWPSICAFAAANAGKLAAKEGEDREATASALRALSDRYPVPAPSDDGAQS